MADKKLTDSETVKALIECSNNGCNENNGRCTNCPYLELGRLPEDCMSMMAKDALDLITRQKAEIEMLNEELRKVPFDWVNRDSLMDRLIVVALGNDYHKFTLLYIDETINDVMEHEQKKANKTKDNLVKEMVGETNNPQLEHEAHWIISSDGYYPYCSECGEEPQDGEMAEFCPNCLAKMNNSR